MSHVSPSFDQLGLKDAVLKAIAAVGYERPSPIQAQCIPELLAGRDLLGQAQTGTGKTAAFALPILSRLGPQAGGPQALVLAPTRELAIQVAEAFQAYASQLPGFHVLPIYGGQEYGQQIRALKRGVHVVVGTPGRVMDHMRKGTLKLDKLEHLVLDEADEMLRMGFIDDVEWILSQTPQQRQIALFSATMPKEIAKVANTYLRDPARVSIEVKTQTADTIRQRYWAVAGLHKLDAVTRLLETEPFDGMIIFVRTKTTTVELADKLSARGFAAAALNGDVPQNQRERTVEKLKNGQIDILVATDVAARGLDVERVSHVLNYDIPYDTEAYVHRIGRTGRAGRSGDAILFVAPRERRMLHSIEKATRSRIEPMQMPSAEVINEHRIQRLKQQVIDTVINEDLGAYQRLVTELQHDSELDAAQIAAALIHISQGSHMLLKKDNPVVTEKRALNDEPRNKREKRDKSRNKTKRDEAQSIDFDVYRLEVGKSDGVRPADIVGAIANEADIDRQYIGRINLFEGYSTVELPTGMPKSLFRHLKKVWVCQKQLNLSLHSGQGVEGATGKGPTPKTDKPRKVRKRHKA